MLVILSVTLENWKSHSATRLDFAKGTNVLLGRMGAGKSSVLDAVCFALYGTFPKMGRRDTTTESLVNFSSGAETAIVKVEFEKGGKKYEVERKAGKKVSEAEIREDGKLVQKGSKAVTDHIVSILGVDYDLFTRAIYSEQNKIDYLLSLNPRQRKGEIDWLLGLGQFDEAREAASSLTSKLAEQSALFAAEATPDKMALLNKKIWELSEQAGEAERKAAALKSEEQSAAKLEAELSAVQIALEKSKSAHQEASNEFQGASAVYERLRKDCQGKELPSPQALEEIEKKMAEASSSEKSEAARARDLSARLSAAKSSLAVAENSIKISQQAAKRKAELVASLHTLTGGKMVETLQKELAEEKSELDSMLEIHAGLHAQSNELAKSIETLSSSQAKCPVCDADLSGGRAGKIADEKRKRKTEGESLAAKHQQEITEKRERVAALEKNLSSARAFESELASPSLASQQDPALLEKEMARLKEVIEASSKSAAEAEEKSSLFRKQSEAARLVFEEMKRSVELFTKLAQAKAKAESAQSKLSSTSFDEPTYEKTRKAHESSRVDRARLKVALEAEEKQLALLSQMLQAEKKLAEEFSVKAAIGEKYRLASESMAIYKNSLAAAQAELRSTLVEEINSALTEIWPSIYPYSDYGGVKIEANEKDYLVLMEKAGWQEVDSVASGGERACLCLALRVAFAAVLTPDLGWLILDEPTHNLDTDAVQLLSDAINSKIPSIVEQTFVVTHELTLGENADCKIFRLERDKAKNESSRLA